MNPQVQTTEFFIENLKLVSKCKTTYSKQYIFRKQ